MRELINGASQLVIVMHESINSKSQSVNVMCEYINGTCKSTIVMRESVNGESKSVIVMRKFRILKAPGLSPRQVFEVLTLFQFLLNPLFKKAITSSIF